jgi:hypothetical protein
MQACAFSLRTTKVFSARIMNFSASPVFAFDPARLVLFQIKAHTFYATAPEEAPVLTRLARAWPRHFPT